MALMNIEDVQVFTILREETFPEYAPSTLMQNPVWLCHIQTPCHIQMPCRIQMLYRIDPLTGTISNFQLPTYRTTPTSLLRIDAFVPYKNLYQCITPVIAPFDSSIISCRPPQPEF